jgi:hypothetical protein
VPRTLEDLVEQGGWKVVGTGEVGCPFEYKALETHWQAQLFPVIDFDNQQVVILAIGEKIGNRLVIGGEEIEL